MSGRLFIAISAGFPYNIFKPESKMSSSVISGSLYITEGNKMTGDLSVNFSNGFNPWLALTKDDSKLKQYIGGGIKPADIKQVKSAVITQMSTTATVNIQKDNAMKKDSSFWFFTLPFAVNGIESWGIKILTAERIRPA